MCDVLPKQTSLCAAARCKKVMNSTTPCHADIMWSAVLRCIHRRPLYSDAAKTDQVATLYQTGTVVTSGTQIATGARVLYQQSL
jgi:hypothetical protein